MKAIGIILAAGLSSTQGLSSASAITSRSFRRCLTPHDQLTEDVDLKQ